MHNICLSAAVWLKHHCALTAPTKKKLTGVSIYIHTSVAGWSRNIGSNYIKQAWKRS